MNQMTCEQAIEYIHSLGRFSPVPGLERMRRLMALLGNPQDQVRTVHLAGTNGKGSTATMIAAMLKAAGYRTGLTISPFILDFRERIQVNGEMIPPDALARTVAQICPLAEQLGDVIEFELVTAAAFCYFAEQQCDIAVIETGLGGRLDSTNVLAKPEVAVITSISHDHTELLGNTIEQIAREKCGIIKQGMPVVTCGGQDAHALTEIRAACATHGCTLSQPDLSSVRDVRLTLEGTSLAAGGLPLFIPLAGRYQIDNALTAVEVCRRLAAHGFARLDDDAITRGLAAVRFPARFEVMTDQPPIILDGAHNPGGAAVLADALALAGERPLIAVIGMLADKDSAAALETLAPCFARMLCVAPPSPRALAPDALARLAQQCACVDAAASASLEQALEQARAWAVAHDGAVIVCGSLYLAAAAREYLTNK